MRMMLAGIAVGLIATPALAQRLDTRVTAVAKAVDGTECRLNANRAMKITEWQRRAFLFQPPVDGNPQIDIALGLTFRPMDGTRFGVGASVLGVQLDPIGGYVIPPPVAAKLVIDGQDSDVQPLIQHNPDRPGAVYLTIPIPTRAAVVDQMLLARTIEFETVDGAGTTTRYRFDGLRIRDAAETLGIVKFSCGAR